ncbi:caspase-8-like [Spea bombifrons]|uniref:caspase-8-like n=1 Tax=Spea bombifrons TaxID=233779 RepID=UPI00234BFE00|nr:caspase-8-like [Spea bombifrons]
MVEFQSMLLKLEHELDANEVKELMFLCKDLILPTPNIKVLFDKLQENGLLGEDNIFIIKELLYSIRRYDLLKTEFNTQREQMMEDMKIPGLSKIIPYRHLLYDLSLHVSNDDLSKVKHLLSNDIYISRMQNIEDMLDIFTEMEKKAILHPDSLERLKNIMKTIDENLMEKIVKYEQSRMSF